jgi:hypothetical protein
MDCRQKLAFAREYLRKLLDTPGIPPALRTEAWATLFLTADSKVLRKGRGGPSTVFLKTRAKAKRMLVAEFDRCKSANPKLSNTAIANSLLRNPRLHAVFKDAGFSVRRRRVGKDDEPPADSPRSVAKAMVRIRKEVRARKELRHQVRTAAPEDVEIKRKLAEIINTSGSGTWARSRVSRALGISEVQALRCLKALMAEGVIKKRH